MWAKIYRFYYRNIYPFLKNFRGATRLRIILKELSLKKLEKVSEEEVIDIFEQDWDNIILIDSCRHDIFKEITGYNGKRISKGSATREYIKKNFSTGKYEEVVYIAANPQFADDRFEALTGRKPEEVFHTIFQPFYADWDYKDNCVKAEPVIRDVKTARKLFPHKKIFVHFLQPHQPFFRKNFDTSGMRKNITTEENQGHIWKEANKGHIPREDVLDGYKKNIQYIEKFVDEAESYLEGKTYLTSDHGNLIDDGGHYGHPAERKEKPLREVPWVEL